MYVLCTKHRRFHQAKVYVYVRIVFMLDAMILRCVYIRAAGSKVCEFKSPLAYQTRCVSIFSDK